MVFVCPKQNACSWDNNCISTKQPHLEPLCTFQVPTGYSHAVPRQEEHLAPQQGCCGFGLGLGRSWRACTVHPSRVSQMSLVGDLLRVAWGKGRLHLNPEVCKLWVGPVCQGQLGCQQSGWASGPHCKVRRPEVWAAWLFPAKRNKNFWVLI